MEREKVIEIFLGLILIVLLLIMILLFAKTSETNNSTITISNSYNTNSYNNPLILKNQNYDYIKTNYENKNLRYISNGEYRRTKVIFGNNINKYNVYVKNKEYAGGYFTVKFYFKDKYGNVKTNSETRYIKPHETRKFSYQKVYDDKTYYWKYNIVSHSKIPKTNNKEKINFYSS